MRRSCVEDRTARFFICGAFKLIELYWLIIAMLKCSSKDSSTCSEALNTAGLRFRGRSLVGCHPSSLAADSVVRNTPTSITAVAPPPTSFGSSAGKACYLWGEGRKGHQLHLGRRLHNHRRHKHVFASIPLATCWALPIRDFSFSKLS